MMPKDAKYRFKSMGEVVTAIDKASEELFGGAGGSRDACACGGRFDDVGKVLIAGDTQADLLVEGRAGFLPFRFDYLGSRLERRSLCSALRLRATKPTPAPGAGR